MSDHAPLKEITCLGYSKEKDSRSISFDLSGSVYSGSRRVSGNLTPRHVKGSGCHEQARRPPPRTCWSTVNCIALALGLVRR